MNRFNEWVAVKLTQAVSTMWAAYLFMALAILGFPYHNLNLTSLVQWTSQTFIQLVMLAVIMVGQKVLEEQNNKTAKSHEELHDKVDKVMKYHVEKRPASNAD